MASVLTKPFVYFDESVGSWHGSIDTKLKKFLLLPLSSWVNLGQLMIEKAKRLSVHESPSSLWRLRLRCWMIHQWRKKVCWNKERNQFALNNRRIFFLRHRLKPDSWGAADAGWALAGFKDSFNLKKREKKPQLIKRIKQELGKQGHIQQVHSKPGN